MRRILGGSQNCDDYKSGRKSSDYLFFKQNVSQGPHEMSQTNFPATAENLYDLFHNIPKILLLTKSCLKMSNASRKMFGGGGSKKPFTGPTTVEFEDNLNRQLFYIPPAY